MANGPHLFVVNNGTHVGETFPRDIGSRSGSRGSWFLCWVRDSKVIRVLDPWIVPERKESAGSYDARPCGVALAHVQHTYPRPSLGLTKRAWIPQLATTQATRTVVLPRKRVLPPTPNKYSRTAQVARVAIAWERSRDAGAPAIRSVDKSRRWRSSHWAATSHGGSQRREQWWW